MEKLTERRVFNANGVFDTGYLCGKSLYLYCFKKVPSSNYMGRINGEKAFEAIRKRFSHLVRSVHTYRYFDSKSKQYSFSDTFLVMLNNCILEFDNNYCEIYHDGAQDEFIADCTSMMKTYKE